MNLFRPPLLLLILFSLSLLPCRYDDTMGGVVISYSDVEILQRCGRVLFDNPFIHFYVATKFLVFSPSIGGHLGESPPLFPVEVSLICESDFSLQ